MESGFRTRSLELTRYDSEGGVYRLDSVDPCHTVTVGTKAQVLDAVRGMKGLSATERRKWEEWYFSTVTGKAGVPRPSGKKTKFVVTVKGGCVRNAQLLVRSPDAPAEAWNGPEWEDLVSPQVYAGTYSWDECDVKGLIRHVSALHGYPEHSLMAAEI